MMLYRKTLFTCLSLAGSGMSLPNGFLNSVQQSVSQLETIDVRLRIPSYTYSSYFNYSASLCESFGTSTCFLVSYPCTQPIFCFHSLCPIDVSFMTFSRVFLSTRFSQQISTVVPYWSSDNPKYCYFSQQQSCCLFCYFPITALVPSL